MLVQADIRPPIHVCYETIYCEQAAIAERFMFASSDRCMRLRDFNGGKSNI